MSTPSKRLTTPSQYELDASAMIKLGTSGECSDPARLAALFFVSNHRVPVINAVGVAALVLRGNA